MKCLPPIAVILIFLALLVGACFLVQRSAERQASLDRQLVAAVDGENVGTVVMLLNEGDNANTREDDTLP